MDEEERRRKIRDFSFDKCKRGNQGFQRILLQLFGYNGHGKSSFINSAICAWFKSDYKNYANSEGDVKASTEDRMTYPLTKNIVLVDNRGCPTMTAHETGEIFAQLANLLPLERRVKWSKGLRLPDRIVEAEPHVKGSGFIIPIFIYSAMNFPTPELKEELRKMFKTASQLIKITPIVVLTHKNHQNYKDVENMFLDIGAETVFPLENYTDQNPHKNPETNGDIIKFLYEVISDVEFRADHCRNANEEMMERKFLVLNYIHTRELMVQKENLERENNMQMYEMEQAFRLRHEEEQQVERRNRDLYKERMEEMQRDFQRQRLREEFQHEQRMKELARRKGRKK
ncbi:uncharacterized protein [Engystomops pustulosus]|uniref:uncharacterized protein n=1 Tax=Engystomops pustulosus TaxID=76066 RepID=UPI003AFA4C19